MKTESEKIKKTVIAAVIITLSLLITGASVCFTAVSISKYREKARIESGYGDEINSANPYAEDVTMIQLIAAPEKYDGKLVRVIGVGNLDFEDNCLSLDMEDYKHFLGNEIWLELGERSVPYEEAQKYNGQYVIVEGFFDKNEKGHFGMFKGTIKDISRYEPWTFDRDEFEKQVRAEK